MAKLIQVIRQTQERDTLSVAACGGGGDYYLFSPQSGALYNKTT